MRASPQRRPVRFSGVVTLLGALAVALGALSCGGSTPMDQWITMNPEAGAGFDAPVRETSPATDGGVDSSTGTGDDSGTVTDDAATSDVGTGSSDAGDSDAAAAAD